MFMVRSTNEVTRIMASLKSLFLPLGDSARDILSPAVGWDLLPPPTRAGLKDNGYQESMGNISLFHSKGVRILTFSIEYAVHTVKTRKWLMSLSQKQKHDLYFGYAACGESLMRQDWFT